MAVAFGLLTLKEGSTVLFGGPQARAAAGQIMPFVGGGAHETRTVVAMTLRTLAWAALAAVTWKTMAPRRI